MNSDFGSLTWVNDKEGHEYVCVIDRQDTVTNYESLSEGERSTCNNVNDFIATDRW
ncbi:MAG: hypothetical protein OEL83_05330 [Desulforhopalus sp.]|nr:hypothetical protein [Desulforhopalus sp.]